MIILLNSIAAAVILINGLFFTINRMGRHTRHGIRFAWMVMVTGSLGVLLGPLFGYPPPSPAATLMHIGFALFVMFNRRKPGDLRGIAS